MIKFKNLLDGEQILRWFFSFFYLTTLIEWYFGSYNAGFLSFLKNFSSDLNGARVGIEPVDLWLKIDLAPDGFLRTILFAAGAIFCIILASNRFRLLSSTGLLLVINLVAYSIGGRIYIFEVISYAYIGYWAGNIASSLIWKNLNVKRTSFFTSINAVGVIYTSAAISKVFYSGWSWVSYEHFSRLLHNARFRYELGLMSFRMPDEAFNFILSQEFLCILSLCLVIVIEFYGIFTILLKKYYYTSIWSLLVLHFGMYFLAGVIWNPLMLMLVIWAIPWGYIKEVNDFSLTQKEIKFVFLFSLALLATSWIIPSSESYRTKVIWPFSSFGVYSKTDQQNNYLYFRSGSDVIFQNTLLIRELKMSSQQMHVSAPIIGDYCEFLKNRLSPDSMLRRKRINLWKRNFPFDEQHNKIVVTDEFVKNCL
ncbi:hypothetical protein K2P97_07125 [bacterium]|nr:hypothetical protein [bacterium]